MRLFGMRAVVTGGGSGIGEAIVRTLAKHGAEVMAVDCANSGIETHFKSVRGVRGAVVDFNAADAATQLLFGRYRHPLPYPVYPFVAEIEAHWIFAPSL